MKKPTRQPEIVITALARTPFGRFFGGLREVESFSYVEGVAFSHESWRGRIRTSNGVGATLSPDEVDDFDRALAALWSRRRLARDRHRAEPGEGPCHVTSRSASRPARLSSCL